MDNMDSPHTLFIHINIDVVYLTFNGLQDAPKQCLQPWQADCQPTQGASCPSGWDDCTMGNYCAKSNPTLKNLHEPVLPEGGGGE